MKPYSDQRPQSGRARLYHIARCSALSLRLRPPCALAERLLLSMPAADWLDVGNVIGRRFESLVAAGKSRLQLNGAVRVRTRNNNGRRGGRADWWQWQTALLKSVLAMTCRTSTSEAARPANQRRGQACPRCITLHVAQSLSWEHAVELPLLPLPAPRPPTVKPIIPALRRDSSTAHA